MSHILEFLDLVDVPNDYSGFPSTYVKVNSGATALEFVVDNTVHIDGLSEYYEYTNKATIVDADVIPLEDSAASWAKKKVTAANLATYVETGMGGPFLPLSAGSGEALTGILYSDNGNIVLQQGGTSSSYSQIYDSGTSLKIAKGEATGETRIDISPTPNDGSSASTIDLFLSTTTSGTRQLIIYDGTAGDNAQHTFNAGTGNVTLCQQGGFLSVAGNDVFTEGAGEINGIAASTVALGDILLTEDTSDSWNKKKVAVSAIVALADGSVVKSIFDAYQSTGTTVIGTSFTDIPWQTERKKDSEFIHSASSAEIEFDFSGDVLITADFTAVNANASVRYQTEWIALLDPGGGYAEIDGTKAYGYHRVLNTGTNTANTERFTDRCRNAGHPGT